MAMRHKSWAWGIGALVALTGCSTAPPAAGTGAREAVQSYSEALLRQDWTGAYRALHPTSQARCTADQFARLGAQYHRNLGFVPDKLQVRSCEEHGTEAIAHIVFTGRVMSRQRQYKDGVLLRYGTSGWGIVLASNFGRGRGP